jgi:hypothetical protein
MSKALLIALTAGVALVGFAWLGRPARLPKAPSKREVERWEGEGGNLAPPARASDQPIPNK